MPSKRRFFKLASLAALLLCTLPALADHADEREDRDEHDPVVLSFATLGDSRQDPTTPNLNKEDSIWLQNTKVWSRLMREIGARSPQLLFFNGDMIMGYTDAGIPANHEASNRQYAFWRGMVTRLFEGGTYVVPVPGNHEVQTKTPKKKALVANEQLWRDNMGDLILDDARFTALVGQAPARFDPANNPSTTSTAAADLITTDQKQLSYSFDVGAAHFVVINTDPVGRDTHAPAAWLAADLRLASASGAKRFFVFGHKPAFSYQFVQADGTLSPPTSGLDAAADLASPGGRDEFWSLIEQYGATYFCGHEHLYDVSQPKGQAWQVIVGSGGSPFEATAVAPADRTYAYAVVRVHRSGRTVATTYGFGEALGPTKLLKRWELR